MHRYHNPDNIVRNEPWYDTDREVVKVCFGECCSQKQPDVILETLLQHFRGTDMQLVAAPAAGDCSNGNTVVVNNKTWLYGMEKENVCEAVDRELERQRASGEVKSDKPRINVCHGPSCNRNQAKPILQVLQSQLPREKYDVSICGCTGFCKRSNNVVVNGRVLSFQTARIVADSVNRELKRQETPQDLKSEIDEILGLY